MDSTTHPIALLGYTAIISYTFNLTIYPTMALAFGILNIKALPLVYHLRILPSLLRLYYPFHPPPWRTSPSNTTNANDLFRTHTTRTRACALECDINMHKSNSTFFTDMDVSRAALLSALFGPALRHDGLISADDESCAPTSPTKPTQCKEPPRPNLILGGTQATFFRPIAPYQAYEVRSRVLGWDAKWMYVRTCFVRPGAGEEESGRWMFATAVSKYVVKSGRKTVAPRRLVEVGGFGGGEAVEEMRVRGMEGVEGTVG